MAHQVEDNSHIVFTGATPWHGLGVHFEQAPTCQDLIDNPTLNFPVAKWGMAVMDISKPVEEQVPFPVEDKFGLVNALTGKYFATVSDSYVPFQNEEAFRFFEGFEKDGLAQIETAGILGGGKRVWVLAKMLRNGKHEGKQITKADGDKVMPYWLFSTGHDGESAITITPTMVRVVCANTLGFADARSTDYRVRIIHKSGAQQAVCDLEKITRASMKGMVETEEFLLKAATLPINLRDLENYFRNSLNLPYRDPFQVVQDQMKYEEEMEKGKRALENVQIAYEEEALSLPPSARNTAYHAIQAVTNYTGHKRNLSNPESRLNQNWFGYGKLIRDRAWEMAWAGAKKGDMGSVVQDHAKMIAA